MIHLGPFTNPRARARQSGVTGNEDLATSIHPVTFEADAVIVLTVL